MSSLLWTALKRKDYSQILNNHPVAHVHMIECSQEHNIVSLLEQVNEANTLNNSIQLFMVSLGRSHESY